MGKTKKKVNKPKSSSENLLKRNLKVKNKKVKPLCKKAVIYNIIDDSIVEPNNTNVVYTDEDDSFHEVKPKSKCTSDKTSTPLKPYPPIRSPKQLFKCLESGNFSQSVKLGHKTPMREQVTNVSNLLSNVSIILQQISESNESHSHKVEVILDDNPSNENRPIEKNSDVMPKTVENISLGDNNTKKNDPSNLGQTPDLNQKYVSQLHVNLSTTSKNSTTASKTLLDEKIQTENSNIEYDSFLQEFHIKNHPHVNENNTKDMSWDQFFQNEKFDISDMVKIDPNLAEFINAPGSNDEKMKYLILKLGELAEQNEELKKHVEWLSDQYNKQNIELEKQFLPLNDSAKNIEEKNPEELLREYHKLNHKYHALNNHLDDALRHKESYKKALVLTKTEKDSLEKDLLKLNEFDDDRERMNELLNIQSTLRLDLKNSTDRNTGLRHDIKTLNEENYRLRHELSNAQRKITELKHLNEKQKIELENLQEVCNLQQKDLNVFSDDKDTDLSAFSYNNSKSWIEQVLDEEKYSDNDDDSQNCSTDISLESVSSGDLDNSIHYPPENGPIEVSDTEKVEDYFYNKNFFFRQSSFESKYFQTTSDPIKVKLRNKNHNTICKYYLSDSCKFKEKCHFLHPNQPNHPPNSYSNYRSAQNNYHKTPNSPQNLRSPSHQFRSRRLNTHPNQSSFPLQGKPNFQVRNFPNSPVRGSPYPSENYDREYRSYGRNTWNPNRNETCFYYMRGVCRYGSGCHFYHPPPTTSPLQPHPQH